MARRAGGVGRLGPLCILSKKRASVQRGAAEDQRPDLKEASCTRRGSVAQLAERRARLPATERAVRRLRKGIAATHLDDCAAALSQMAAEPRWSGCEVVHSSHAPQDLHKVME